ncbi:MAG: DEAD/DEAH box helicase [Gammaproteobacteria bacterium]|nr:DEAD/DEAH box helicase [Gammaproteobacteria bacterium]
MSEQHLTDIPFGSLALDSRLLRALEVLKFDRCTPIQAESLPLLLSNKDVSGQAQTGTGKTLAFLLACAQRLLNSDTGKTEPGKPRVLILAPTRELAIQIHKDAVDLLTDIPLTTAICYGGKAYEKQKQQFQEPADFLIGTPGRLIDFFKQKLYNLKSVEVMVLDEADRMFDMGFISDVRFLLRRLPSPEKRLSMLFSATMAHKVMELAYEHMNQAQVVKIDSSSPAVERISQSIYHPANHEKIPLLLGLMKQLNPERSIIFINTKHTATRVWGYLEGNGYRTALISGDIHQNKREKLLQKFHQGEYAILVATDVASRGLHIPDVTHIFNYDLPELGEDYVHRIGRTARAGNSGHAISFACEDYAMNLLDIETYTRTSIPSMTISNDLLADPKPPIKLKKSRPLQSKRQSNNKNGRQRNRSRSNNRSGSKSHQSSS